MRVGEERPRGGSGPLLAHPQQRDLGRADHQRGGGHGPLGAHQVVQPVAPGPVPDLVVVLGAHHEPVARGLARGSRGPAGVGVHQRRRHLLRCSVRRVVGSRLAGEHGVDGVVEVVGPRRVQPLAPVLAGQHLVGRTVLGLGGQPQRSTELFGQVVHFLGQLLQEVHR